MGLFAHYIHLITFHQNKMLDWANCYAKRRLGSCYKRVRNANFAYHLLHIILYSDEYIEFDSY